jgi:hypothetical protein
MADAAHQCIEDFPNKISHFDEQLCTSDISTKTQRIKMILE